VGILEILQATLEGHDLFFQMVDPTEEHDGGRAGKRVIGRLVAIDVIDGMKTCCTGLGRYQFIRSGSDDFIQIHVQAGARSALP
jgi:hypothetical protein